MANPLIVILGPTASGKTRLASHLAYQLEGEIISADSRQVYKGMDIGTGKDLGDYVVNGKPIAYHIIDICEPGEKYHINRFYSDFEDAYHSITGRGNLPIMCGGSGLYIETALLGNAYASIPVLPDLRAKWASSSDEELRKAFEQLPLQLRSQLDQSTRKRMVRALEIWDFLGKNELPQRKNLGFRPIIIGTLLEREERRERITKRLKHRMENGLIEEVERLVSQGLDATLLDYYGLEYRWVGLYLQGEIDKQTLFDRLNVAIHQFAKRQMTWFRKMERDGWEIHWIDATKPFEEQLNDAVEIIGKENRQP